MKDAPCVGQEEAGMFQLLSAQLESIMEETMDLKGLRFNEVDGPKQLQSIRGVYRGLKYEIDLLQEAGVRKVKGMRGIYRGVDFQADFLTAGEAKGFPGIYRGVAYEREFLPEEKPKIPTQADQVDPEAEIINQIIPPNRTDSRNIPDCPVTQGGSGWQIG
jgi:nitrogen regulatory protein PII